MNRLERAFEVYTKEVEAYAAERFNAVVKPWLDKHNYRFLSGNGTYLIQGATKSSSYDNYIDPETEIPKRIYNVLEMEVPGYEHSQSLAGFMRDYDPLKGVKDV